MPVNEFLVGNKMKMDFSIVKGLSVISFLFLLITSGFVFFCCGFTSFRVRS